MTGAELLGTHLQTIGQSPAEFARASRGKVNEPELSRWLSGKGRPGLDKAVILGELTDGKVPPEAWAKRKARRNRKAA